MSKSKQDKRGFVKRAIDDGTFVDGWITDDGYMGLILKNRTAEEINKNTDCRVGLYNGYCRLPVGHTLIGKDLSSESGGPEVHGGITYADGRWFGFDCCHAWDSPESCPLDYVRQEVKSMIEGFRKLDVSKEAKEERRISDCVQEDHDLYVKPLSEEAKKVFAEQYHAPETVERCRNHRTFDADTIPHGRYCFVDQLLDDKPGWKLTP